MNRFFHVKVNGTPYERGRQTAAQAGSRITSLIQTEYSYYQQHFGETREQVIHEARKFIPYIRDFSIEAYQEMEGLADGVGCALDDIVMLNCVFELMADRNPLVQLPGDPKGEANCTAFGASNDATLDGKIFVGQNIDGRFSPWHALYDEFDYLLQSTTEKGLKFITYVHSGLLTLAGMNSEGLGLCMNNLHNGEYRVGVPYVVLAREMLEKTSIEDAIDALDRAERSGCLNFLLGDAKGNLLDIEATMDDYDLLRSEDLYVHSNHFVSEKIKKAIKFDVGLLPTSNSTFRRDRVLEMLKMKYGEIALDSMFHICRDHEGYPSSICAHGNPELPQEHQARTFVGMVFDLSERSAWYVKGWPCEGEFYPYEF